jgi:hypothetical protein
LFVSGWAIKRRYRDVVEAKIDAELCRVVDEVIEAHLPKGKGA